MPLPKDVGEAIVDYLRNGHAGASHALFVAERGPHVPFKDGQIVNSVLREAFARTGMKPPQKWVGSHLLRHSLATEMLRKGASLEEIGDVLRHRSRMSTTSMRSTTSRRCARSRAHGRLEWTPMIPLSVRLKQYIAMRRSLGFDLFFAERVLRKFAEFADRERADHITVDLFLRWKERYGSANNLTWWPGSAWCESLPAGSGLRSRTEVPPGH